MVVRAGPEAWRGGRGAVRACAWEGFSFAKPCLCVLITEGCASLAGFTVRSGVLGCSIFKIVPPPPLQHYI